MMNSIWHIKIPTYAGILLLFLVLGATIFLTGNNRLFNIRAIPSNTPAQVRITNISDTSFSVSYTTTESTTGTISVGETKDAGRVVIDDQDKGGNPKPYQLHYFLVTNLKPDTTYYFTILSGNTAFNDNKAPYSLKTAPALAANTAPQKTISGKVLLPDGTSPKKAVAYIQIGASQLVSALIQMNGSYSFNLSNLRTQNLSQYALIADSDRVNIIFIGDGRQATATLSAKDATQVPPITLSQTYAFTVQAPVKQTTTASESAQPPIPQFSDGLTVSEKLEILVPGKNQPFTDSQPEFSGTAFPGSNVNIVIQAIKEFSGVVKTGEDGLWTFRPSQKLEPGVYTLTVTGEDSKGNPQTAAESFIIYAEGSQFTDPSVAPTKVPTIVPTTIPAGTPSATITSTPSPSVFPTPTTVSPTNIPIPTAIIITALPSPQPSIIPPGSNEIFVSVGLITFATIVSALLFFLIRV